VSRLCEFYPDICLTAEEKARKNLSQGKKNFSQVKKNLRVQYTYCQNTHTTLATFDHSFTPAHIDGGLLCLVQHLHGRLISLVENERRLLAYLRGQDGVDVC
jgi:hypothetical protein